MAFQRMDAMRERLASLGRRHPWWMSWGVAVLACGLVAGSWLTGYFLSDDFGYVGRFTSLPWSAWPRLFVQDWSGGIWGFALPEVRPTMALSFMVDGRLWGGDPLGYHLTNLLYSTLAAAFAGWLAYSCGGKDLLAAWAAAMLFMVHPAHAEPLGWITGRVDSLATVLYLAALCCHIRFRQSGSVRWLAGGCLALGAGLFSKEFVVSAPLMALMLDVAYQRRGPRRSWLTWTAPYAAWIALVLTFAVCRRAALGETTPGYLHELPSAPGKLLVYLGFVWPPLDRWQASGTWIAPHLGLALGLAALVSLVVIVGLVWRRGDAWRACAVFGVGWQLVATVPLVVMGYRSPRHVFLASVGACVLVALVGRIWLPRRVFVLAVLAVVAVWTVELRGRLGEIGEAGRLSRRLHDEMVRTAAESPLGAPLLIDASKRRGEQAWFWAWASPFMARPPFTATALDVSHPLLTRPALYSLSKRWDAQPVIQELTRTARPGWLIVVGENGDITRREVPAKRLRVAAGALAGRPPRTSATAAWDGLVAALEK
jgi:hypothetical protein